MTTVTGRLRCARSGGERSPGTSSEHATIIDELSDGAVDFRLEAISEPDTCPWESAADDLPRRLQRR
ncbi:hypothetical protein ACQPXH_11575 [Nocardia sp. CA-135953]|uniref:hypothetical protein n=1 Tax=Nocardia sp. CA-135953 TaxID=3239978 RepID=UPI003D957AE3